MPSLAKKSMNFVRDVYALASNPDRPPQPPSQLTGASPSPYGPPSSYGLSTQFSPPPQAQYGPYYNLPYPPPTSPYMRPASSQGQYPPQHPPTTANSPSPYLAPHQGPPPQHQPYGSWSNPVSPPPPHHPQYAGPAPTTTTTPSPISSPQSHPAYQVAPAHGQHPGFRPPPQPPTLPDRRPVPLPLTTWSNAGSGAPMPSGSPNPGYSRPLPPPLPRRTDLSSPHGAVIQGLNGPILAGPQYPAPQYPASPQSAYSPPPNVMLSPPVPSTATYHEMAAAPPESGSYFHQYPSTDVSHGSQPLVQGAARPASPVGYVAELPAQSGTSAPHPPGPAPQAEDATARVSSPSRLAAMNPSSGASEPHTIPVPTSTTPAPLAPPHGHSVSSSTLAPSQPGATHPPSSPSQTFSAPDQGPFDMRQLADTVGEMGVNQQAVNHPGATGTWSGSPQPMIHPALHNHQPTWNSPATQPYPAMSPPTTMIVAPQAATPNYWPDSTIHGAMVHSQQHLQLQHPSPAPQMVNPTWSHQRPPQPRVEPEAEAVRVQGTADGSRPRKILALDGGGIRGLSSLIILDYVMDMLGTLRGARLEPWQEFDMIAGTSTGGLIAIMLGRLRMSVADCITAYKEMSRKIFTPAHSAGNLAGKTVDFLKAKGRFRSEPLEESIRDMLRSRGLPDDELLVDRHQDSPAVFVCAVEGINSDAVVIRSYKSREFDDLFGVCRIWEAARATSAASTFFDPIKIGDRLYVDGALKHNNPIEKVDEESKELWPGQERLIISIGTGSAPGPDVTGDLKALVEAIKKIVTETEDTSNAFRKRNRDMINADRLFRFNVFHGLADVGLAEHEAAGKVAAHTATYLKKFDTARDVEKCAQSLKATGQRLGYIAGEELSTYREVQRVSVLLCEFCEDCHRGIPYSETLFLCPECGMIICRNCHPSHDDDHMRQILRFRSMQWMPNLPGLTASASCWHCAEDSKVRWQCDKCASALCRRCAGMSERRDAFLKEHQTEHPDHRSFLALYPPYWTMAHRWVTHDCPCMTIQPGPACHCDRCHLVVPIGGRVYGCATCLAEFGSVQTMCHNCYDHEDAGHLAQHRWTTTDFVPSNTGLEMWKKGTKLALTCPLCPGEQIYDGREHLHPHDHLQMVLSPLLVELSRLSNIQFCQRDRIRRDKARAVNPTTIKCLCCSNLLCFDEKAAICFTTGCLWAYCGACLSAKRVRHRHPLTEVSISWPPADAFNRVKCCVCLTMWEARNFQGLWCGDCNDWDLCIQCAAKLNEGTLTIEDGLSHLKASKLCKSRDWIWYVAKA